MTPARPPARARFVLRLSLRVLCVLCGEALPVRAVAESGFVPVAQATAEAPLYLDAQVEVPPVHSGRQALSKLAAGDSVQFQVFMPSAGGRLTYGIALSFSDSAGSFEERFEIGTARSDFRPPDASRAAPAASAGATGARGEALVAFPLDAPRGSRGPLRSILFTEPWELPTSGLLAVLTLKARQDVDPQKPMALEARVTVLPEVPPVRLIQFRGTAPVRWQ